MLGFVLRRLLVSIPLLLAASALAFALVANSGDPLEELRLNPRISPAVIEAREQQLNLDRPVIERYGMWLGDIVRGDFGEDNSGNPVWPQLWRALKITMRLVIVSTVVAAILALIVGSISALRQYSWFDNLTTTGAFLAFSLPVFVLAVFLKQFGAIWVNDRLEDLGFGRFVATIGHQSPNFSGGFFDQLYDIVGHMLLPVITLSLISFAQYMRFVRGSMLDVISSDYVRTAKAKGVPVRRVNLRHALRNALIPVVTVIAIDFGAVLGGAIVTENVFQWRGMGTLLIGAINGVDVNTMQAWLIVSAVIVVIANLVADVAYAYLDPRIRLD